jgi:hypothetical protein
MIGLVKKIEVGPGRTANGWTDTPNTILVTIEVKTTDFHDEKGLGLMQLVKIEKPV